MKKNAHMREKLKPGETSEITREIWLRLLSEGGYWTAHDVADMNKQPVSEVFECLSRMSRKNLVKKQKSSDGRRLVYGVDGTCNIPQGMAVAEVQA